MQSENCGRMFVKVPLRFCCQRETDFLMFLHPLSYEAAYHEHGPKIQLKWMLRWTSVLSPVDAIFRTWRGWTPPSTSSSTQEEINLAPHHDSIVMTHYENCLVHHHTCVSVYIKNNTGLYEAVSNGLDSTYCGTLLTNCHATAILLSIDMN